MKALKIILNKNITDHFSGSYLSLTQDENGVAYINPNQISQFSFDNKEINFVLGASAELGRPVRLQFNENSMGEYQRVKREIQDAFTISNESDKEIVSAA